MELRLTSDEVITLKEKEVIYSALKRSGIYLTASCGGKGTCGKCKVKIIKGSCNVISYGKLTQKERESNIVLACQAIPEGDILIEIPKESRLAIGDKIAIARTKDLVHYLKSYGVDINPAVKRLYLELPPPTIDDNISDLERLKRSLNEKGLKDMRFSYGFVSTMADTLRIANWNVELTYIRGDDTRYEAIFLSPIDTCNRRFGLAVDIGTTTVVVYLANLLTGEIIDIGSTYNSQMRYGDDVITRIVHATESNGLDELRDAVVSDINTIVDSLMARHSIQSCEIDAATISGNTTMSHIFWGLNPGSIREEPYIPTLNRFPEWRGGTARLSINPQSPVYTVPCVASYVGGDIVAGVLASKMHRNSEIALFMDIGTNGEIAIGNNEWLMTAACSMGPCFEGSGIRCGMRATSGAIESVKIDPHTYEPSISVISGGHPMGICGSGMIDAISEMFLTGLIDQKGKLVKAKTERIREGEDGLEFVLYSDLTHHKDIVLTEVDIENIIRAKAALYAGIKTLLTEVGLTTDAIEKVYIAGGFGNYINIKKAIILGMLLDMPEERFVFMGNTSITGAYLCLMSEELRREAEDIASKMTYIELSVYRSFMDEYMSALFLPHTDMSQFPTVTGMLK
ncbi:iron-sulfur cluster-binding protein [Dissulfurispira thermophila]|uniref:Iron-sulfur cluster-binding protein n=2 Tax=root TaxID=1 RepID=A0A7G1H082_9BACT|nr:ASKHA domain-containing protein [Dissulfurispira thermophila]BCB95679.1 iron-sulfur cluster-binding protein [Dissulfurispira thermophila]